MMWTIGICQTEYELNKIDYSNVFNDVETRIDLLNEKKEEISNDNLDDLW